MKPTIPRNSPTPCRNPAAGEPGSIRQQFDSVRIYLADPFRHVDREAAHRRAEAISQGRIPADGSQN